MTDTAPQTEQFILRASGLVKKYKKRAVVNEVTIQVRQGEIVGLLGPNGAGKTTTFYMIVGMIRPNGGKVFINDTEITSMPMYQRARMGIGYLSQEASVFRRLTVRENLLAVLEISDLPRKEREEKCDRLLEDFGLTHLVKSKAYVLSGGERRRTEIARALALDPKFMLLDEPFAGIDPIAVEDIMKIVTKLKEKNIGVLVTDHNVHETLSITDHSYLLFEGRILKAGTAEFLANDPEAKRLYLGEEFKLDRYSKPKVKQTARIVKTPTTAKTARTVKTAKTVKTVKTVKTFKTTRKRKDV
jgi:lipopolysaccharide export system ATP-binding protein